MCNKSGGKVKKAFDEWKARSRRRRIIFLVVLHTIGYTLLFLFLSVYSEDGSWLEIWGKPFGANPELHKLFSGAIMEESIAEKNEREVEELFLKGEDGVKELAELAMYGEIDHYWNKGYIAIQLLGYRVPINESLPALHKIIHTSEEFERCACVCGTLHNGGLGISWKLKKYAASDSPLSYELRRKLITALTQKTVTGVEDAIFALLCLKARNEFLLALIISENYRYLHFLRLPQLERYLQATESQMYRLWWLENRHKYPKQILPKGWDENKILLEFVEKLRKDKDIATKYKNLLDRTEQEAKKALEEQKDAPQKPSK